MINHIRIMSRESGLIVSFGGDTARNWLHLLNKLTNVCRKQISSTELRSIAASVVTIGNKSVNLFLRVELLIYISYDTSTHFSHRTAIDT